MYQGGGIWLTYFGNAAYLRACVHSFQVLSSPKVGCIFKMYCMRVGHLELVPEIQSDHLLIERLQYFTLFLFSNTVLENGWSSIILF